MRNTVYIIEEYIFLLKDLQKKKTTLNFFLNVGYSLLTTKLCYIFSITHIYQENGCIDVLCKLQTQSHYIQVLLLWWTMFHIISLLNLIKYVSIFLHNLWPRGGIIKTIYNGSCRHESKC